MSNAVMDNGEGLVAVRCECGSEMLVLEDPRDDWTVGEIFASIYELPKGKTPWKVKLRYILRILKYGRPYGDQIIIAKENLPELIKKLREMSL